MWWVLNTEAYASVIIAEVTQWPYKIMQMIKLTPYRTAKPLKQA